MSSLLSVSGPRRFIGRPARPCSKCQSAGRHGLLHYVNGMGGISCCECQPPRGPSDIQLSLVCIGGIWDDALNPFDAIAVERALASPPPASATKTLRGSTSRGGGGGGGGEAGQDANEDRRRQFSWAFDGWLWEHLRVDPVEFDWGTVFGERKPSSKKTEEKDEKKTSDFSFSLNFNVPELLYVGRRVSLLPSFIRSHRFVRSSAIAGEGPTIKTTEQPADVPTFGGSIHAGSTGTVTQAADDQYGITLLWIQLDHGGEIHGIAKEKIEWI